MFTTDNSEFSAADCRILNAAYETLLPEWATEDDNGAKNLSDRLNNVWVEGDTAETLVAKTRGR